MKSYVLQSELTSLEKPLYPSGEDRIYPKTVLIPEETNKLLEFSRKELLERSRSFSFTESNETYHWGMLTDMGVVATDFVHHTDQPEFMWGLELPPAIISNYNLVEGDEVGITISHSKKLVIIASVNGCQDPKVFRSWPQDLSAFQSDYPQKPLPVEKYGDFDLRVITLLAPIGLGSSYWIIAPGGAGKTWILVKILEACLKLLREIPNLHVIMGYVGDRPEDGSQYSDVIHKYKGTRGEFHQAPWNTSPDAQIDTTRFIIRRAQRLTAIGNHVVVLFDSISRTVAAHTASTYADINGGMIAGGIYRQSLTDIIALLFGTHGSFGPDRSLTIIGTVLSASNDKRTSESAVDQETSDTSTTGICRLVSIPTLERPWVSIKENETYTRFPQNKDFRSDVQQQEMEHVRKLMRENPTANSFVTHRILLDYARKNPIPLWV